MSRWLDVAAPCASRSRGKSLEHSTPPVVAADTALARAPPAGGPEGFGFGLLAVTNDAHLASASAGMQAPIRDH